MQTFQIANLKITAYAGASGRICYILCPFDLPAEWVTDAVGKYGVSVAVISGMDWDNDMTPWAAKGQPPGSPDFKGNASAFLSTLLRDVIPEIEHRLNMAADVERTLTGVSLSGLFTLWQWMVNDTFPNIISLSGSFWYEGFAEWVKNQPVPRKKGKAYFLLGNKEAKTNVKAFQPVQTDTEEIVAYLRKNGVDAVLELVPGNHYQYNMQRLERAMTWMFG